MTSHTVTLGRSAYPYVLPNVRDSRLHVGLVVVTVHVLGQVSLGFHVSVPQILSAILACAIVEVAVTFRASRSLVWPASAVLTGSGIALILRVPSTPQGDHWTTHHWYVFAGVACFALSTKYLIRARGGHIFNPSNLGLVVAFLVLGSERVEPLDFWWAPFGPGLVTAYAVILIGGTLITRRLGFLASVMTFWIAIAAGLGGVAASGHCMIARWAFAPVCGFDYWRAVVTSPELLIFLFFMITDPRTVPAGRVGRVLFGLAVAVTSTALMAPQTNEFGTKVALLGSLVIMCAIRPLLERMAPEPGTPQDHLAPFVKRLVIGDDGTGTWPRTVARSGAIAASILLVGVAIIAAGAPARGLLVPAASDVLGRVPHEIDPSTLPQIDVDQDVVDWDHEISGSGATEIVVTLAENLRLEAQALLDGDTAILDAVDHGDRLDEMRTRVGAAATTGETVVDQFVLDSVDITLIVPFGRQSGLSLGLESRGTLITSTYDAAGDVLDRVSADSAATFVMGRPTGGRWMIVAVLPLDAPS